MLSVDTIRYGSKVHDHVKTAIQQRKSFSEKKMTNFHSQWSDADASMRAYIKEKEVDRKRKNAKRYDGEIDYITLEVPYVYAIAMTAHTYYSSVILSRSPIWQFTARHGESQDSVQAVEAIMDYQLKNGGMIPVIYNWLYDLARYSLGIVGEYWDSEQRIVSKYVKQANIINGVNFGGEKLVHQQEIVRGFVGNKLYNIRPYDFFPDPRVPMWKFQEGEFCIRDCNEGYFDILASEHQYKGYYQNLEVLSRIAKEHGASGFNYGDAKAERPIQPGEQSPPGPGSFKITDAYIKLIPRTWGLSSSERIETWCFQLANNEVVISAKPLGAYHNQFPFSIMEGNFGSDEFAKFGMIEVIRPMTDILTWLVNSHFYNVRRVLNNQLVVDPSRIVMKDLTKPGQRIIRMKPAAYGTDPKTPVYQLQMHDVTRGNLSDAQYIENMIQRVSSVVDTVMGVQESGGRRSATESRLTTGWSTSRLKTPVEYNSSLALEPLAQRMLSNTQQYMDFERQYAIAGNLLDTAKRFMQVSPESIAGAYDFVPVDGTAPIDRLAQANFWKEMLMGMARVPQFAAEWDLGGMAAHAMKMQGERNIDRFRRVNVNVLPPGVAPGPGMVPVGGTGNGSVSTRSPRSQPRGTGTSGGTSPTSRVA